MVILLGFYAHMDLDASRCCEVDVEIYELQNKKREKNHKVASIICCFVGYNLDLEEEMILKNIKGRKYLL